MQFDLLPPAEQIVAIMNRIYHGGMTTLTGGNLSIKEPNGDIWITPAAIDKGSLTPEMINCVHADGTVSGPYAPSSELPFHRAIYAQRPDLNAIVHAHAPALVTFSIVRKTPDTYIIPQARRVCGPVGYAAYALPGTEQLGVNIAKAFAGGGNVVLLENHGAAAGGQTLLEGFQRLETLDFCARTQILAQQLGPITTLNDEQMEQFDHRDNYLPEFTPTYHSSTERNLRRQIVKIVQRAYKRQLMISTEGVASARIDDNSFVITPTGADRHSISPHDVVLIHHGQREAGKLPSRSVRLHDAIYRAQPHVQAIVTAQPPYATAYAIADKSFDTKTIPESYIMLMDVPKIPYGQQFNDVERIADRLTPRSPVLLVQNDCVLTTGSSLLQAFDRLEVAEFTARSIIEAATLGDMIPIGADDVKNLEDKYLKHLS